MEASDALPVPGLRACVSHLRGRTRDAATARQVADRARLEVTSVSSHLSRLEKDGIVEKVRAVDRETGKPRGKHAFQVTERFFNIWYLMRASRRARRKLAWFVSFLEVMYGAEELMERARELLRAGAGDPALALALTDSVHHSFVRAALLHVAAASEGSAPLLAAEPDLRAVGAERERRAGLQQRAEPALARLDPPAAAAFRESPLITWDMKLLVVDHLASALGPHLRALEPAIPVEARRVVRRAIGSGGDPFDRDILGSIEAISGADAVHQYFFEWRVGNHLLITSILDLPASDHCAWARAVREELTNNPRLGEISPSVAAFASMAADAVLSPGPAVSRRVAGSLRAESVGLREFELFVVSVRALVAAGQAGVLMGDLLAVGVPEGHPVVEAVRAVDRGEEVLAGLAAEVAAPAKAFFDRIRPGSPGWAFEARAGPHRSG